ncbi:MAG: prepilin peptidase [Paracoccaceae bacterium]
MPVFDMLTFTQTLVFAPFVLAISVWVAWSDMASMKIPNKAVIALGAVWAAVGLLLVIFQSLPLMAWFWGFALAAIFMTAGFVANAAGLIGAGDAKFGAVMAPFFIGADPRLVLALLAACLLGAFVAHRAMRMVPAFRTATVEWASWTNKKFPMGLTLAGMLVFYLTWRLIVA